MDRKQLARPGNYRFECLREGDFDRLDKVAGYLHEIKFGGIDAILPEEEDEVLFAAYGMDNSLRGFIKGRENPPVSDIGLVSRLQPLAFQRRHPTLNFSEYDSWLRNNREEEVSAATLRRQNVYQEYTGQGKIFSIGDWSDLTEISGAAFLASLVTGDNTAIPEKTEWSDIAVRALLRHLQGKYEFMEVEVDPKEEKEQELFKSVGFLDTGMISSQYGPNIVLAWHNPHYKKE